ncbi:hypothetical protein NDU88_000841 [Pleurodeles waltl]|uniref:Uncharacterized protein n=1 Tax=Pleurodeles waltl TaxID=8319 RepID=A0AAV7ND42_PLEWA|nr:hypothetical protein NDU88_000841 [Pleurodeles waltl]
MHETASGSNASPVRGAHVPSSQSQLSKYADYYAHVPAPADTALLLWSFYKMGGTRPDLVTPTRLAPVLIC